MTNIPRYIYISNYLKETVTDSQIVNWLELFRKQGIEFDFMLIAGMRFFFKYRKLYKSKIKEVSKKLSCKTYQFLSIKRETLFGQIIVFIAIFIVCLKDILSKRIIIIQTRYPQDLVALKWLKSFYPKLRIIFDSRGASAEEFLLMKNIHYNQSNSTNVTTYIRKLKREIDFINMSDTVFCVSTKLKKYIFEKNCQLSEDKVLVIPCCADQTKFFWNEDARYKIRHKIGITDKFVLVYSGMLDKAWQWPEFLFYIFSELNKRYPKLYLMCLSPNKNIVNMYIQKYNINKENVFLDYVTHDVINDYLCAADAGLLLRQDIATNNVASPTKFAEYIMSGLPIIISDRLGDFSGFVKENKIGYVINNDTDINKIFNDFKKYFLNSPSDRARISRIGRNFFSKQNYLDKIISVYRNLSTL